MGAKSVAIDSRYMDFEDSLAMDFVSAYKYKKSRVMPRHEYYRNQVKNVFYKGKRAQKTDKLIDVSQVKEFITDVKNRFFDRVTEITDSLSSKISDKRADLANNREILAENIQNIKAKAKKESKILGEKLVENLVGVKDDIITLGEFGVDYALDFRDRLIDDITTRPSRAKKNRFGIDIFLIADTVSDTKNKIFNNIDEIKSKINAIVKEKKKSFNESADIFLDKSDEVIDRWMDKKDQITDELIDHLLDAKDNVSLKVGNLVKEITTKPKRVQKKEDKLLSSIVNSITYKPVRLEKSNFSLRTITDSLSKVKNKIFDKVYAFGNNFKKQGTNLIKDIAYRPKAKRVQKSEISLSERVNNIFESLIALKNNAFDKLEEVQNNLINKIIETYSKNRPLKYASIVASCLALVGVTTLSAFAFFGGKSDSKINTNAANLSQDTSIEYLSPEKEVDSQKRDKNLSSGKKTELSSQTYTYTSTPSYSAMFVDSTPTETSKVIDPEVIETAKVEEEDKVEGVQPTIQNVVDMPSGNDLLDFKAYNYYTCPADVTVDMLIEILGITKSQYDTWAKVILCEAHADVNGYKEVYATATTFFNRIGNSYCVNNYGGTNVYNQAIAPLQYTVFEHGSYLKYDYKGIDYRTVNGYKAIEDAIYNYIVNPDQRAHDYISFRSNDTVNYSNNLFTARGNRYDYVITSYNYPSFLYSDAAVALRNKALGIVEESQEVLMVNGETTIEDFIEIPDASKEATLLEEADVQASYPVEQEDNGLLDEEGLNTGTYEGAVYTMAPEVVARLIRTK